MPATRVAEPRFRLAALAVLTMGLVHAVGVETSPADLFTAQAHPGSGAPAVFVVALALAVTGRSPTHPRPGRAGHHVMVAVSALAAVLAAYAASLGLLEVAQLVFADAPLPARFQRGQPPSAPSWGLRGLGLLYAGLRH